MQRESLLHSRALCRYVHGGLEMKQDVCNLRDVKSNASFGVLHNLAVCAFQFFCRGTKRVQLKQHKVITRIRVADAIFKTVNVLAIHL